MLDNIKQREVEIIHINVVGIISNKEELNEIETVAKVFLVEERVIDITNSEKENAIEKTYLRSSKNIKINQTDINENPTFLTVRGLN